MSQDTGTPIAFSAAPTFVRMTGDQYTVLYNHFQTLQGQILTVIDAVFPEGQQNRSLKDVITNTMWDRYGQICRDIDPETYNDPKPVNAPVVRKRRNT